IGFGVNGDALGGTYNIELGYFDTTIDRLFGSDQIRDVCANYPDFDPLRYNDDIIPPTDFCQYALNAGIESTATAYFNFKTEQDIQGYTIDVAFDFDKWQMDFTFTDMESLEPNPIFEQNAIMEGT